MAAEQRHDFSASSSRIRPWSTKTQVSWSPIASWISTAATAESTPPDRPHITRPLPTCSRMRAIASSRNAPIVQSPRQPAIVVHEVAQERGAVRRVHDFEMELGGVEFARSRRRSREWRVRRRANDVEAWRQRRHPVAVAHPDRIRSPTSQTPSNSGDGVRDLEVGAAELAVMPALDLAAELVGHGLLAVADAEDRHARLEDAIGAQRRALARCTEAGRRRG